MAMSTNIEGHHLTPGMRQKDFLKILEKLGGKWRHTGTSDILMTYPGYDFTHHCGFSPGKDVGPIAITWLRKAVAHTKEKEEMTTTRHIKTIGKESNIGLVGLVILKQTSGPFTTTDIIDKINSSLMTRKQVADAISHLKMGGLVSRTGDFWYAKYTDLSIALGEKILDVEHEEEQKKEEPLEELPFEEEVAKTLPAPDEVPIPTTPRPLTQKPFRSLRAYSCYLCQVPLKAEDIIFRGTAPYCSKCNKLKDDAAEAEKKRAEASLGISPTESVPAPSEPDSIISIIDQLEVKFLGILDDINSLRRAAVADQTRHTELQAAKAMLKEMLDKI